MKCSYCGSFYLSKPMLVAPLFLALSLTSYSALAEDNSQPEKNWRSEVEAMNSKEREAFYEKRQKIKSDLMQMDNDERAEFYQQIGHAKGRAEKRTYVEGTKSETVEHKTPTSASEVEDWEALSYEEKRKLLSQ